MSDNAVLTKPFEKIGARIVIHTDRRVRAPFRLDVRNDRHGEYFDLALSVKGATDIGGRPVSRPPEIAVLNTDPASRHLLLRAGAERFLCGHDERHWFVAAIPTTRVTTVRAAKEALMPPAIRESSDKVRPGKLLKRRNKLFKRQGEWFFIPATRDLSDYPILKNEPITRNARSTPHMCEELIRFGGETVYLIRGVEFSEAEYAAGTKSGSITPDMRPRQLTKNPQVYVRGWVRHPDHKTVDLRTWHRVMMNREVLSANMAFYD